MTTRLSTQSAKNQYIVVLIVFWFLRPQPLPKNFKCERPSWNFCREECGFSILSLASKFATACSVLGPIASTFLTPTIFCRTFAALPVPLFVALSSTAQSHPLSSSSYRTLKEYFFINQFHIRRCNSFHFTHRHSTP